MKKLWAVALSSALLLSVLSACGKNNNNNVAPSPTASASPTGTAAGNANLSGTIKMLTHRTDYINDGTFDRYVAKFKEKYPNANVEFEGLTNYATDIQVRLTTGETGDVLMVPTNVPNSELNKYFEPLPDTMFDNVYFADYLIDQGKRYGISTGVNTQGIVYNKQAFQKAGVDKIPTTLDEFYAACEKLKGAGIIPLYMNFGAQWPMGNWGDNSDWYVQGDPQFHTKMAGMDDPFKMDNAWGTLLTIARTLVDKKYVEKDLATNNWEMSKGEVASGKAAMYHLGNWVIPQVIGAGAKSEDIGFFPLPYDNSGKYNAPLGSDYFIGVSKNSGNKELATAWVDFFVKESGYVSDSGFMPVIKTQEAAVPQLAEFKSFNPTFIESEANDPKFNEIGNKAQIGFGTGKVVQDLITAKDLKAAFDSLNAKWKAARKAVG